MVSHGWITQNLIQLVYRPLSGSTVKTGVCMPNIQLISRCDYFRSLGVCRWWQNQSQTELKLGPQKYRGVSRCKSTAWVSGFFFKRAFLCQTTVGFMISTWTPKLPQRLLCPWMDAILLLLRGRYMWRMADSATLLISLLTALFYSFYFFGVRALE